MGSYAVTVNSLRAAFLRGKLTDVKARRHQLQRLIDMLNDNKELWFSALGKDLHKSNFEAELCEIMFTINEAAHAHNELATWMKPEKVKKGLLFAMDDAYIRREPLGVTLVMGAWNYPLCLTLGPLVGAIAAGNCAVIKPSEMAPAVADLVNKLVPSYLDPDCFAVVCGGIPETTELLKVRFDHIFYTGSPMVGKIVMAAAAPYLTPVVLELGGKSPVYVDSDVDLYKVARSICWGKYMNCGQTCVSPDYVMCKPEVTPKLAEQVKRVVGEFYGEDAKSHPDYCRMVNERHFDRVSKLINKDKVVMGGVSDRSDLFISPTMMTGVTEDDAVMQEEIFGPILPVINVAGPDEAVAKVVAGEKPLALYCFSNNSSIQKKFVEGTSSGGCCVNDVISHMTLDTLPFGGVGNSGMGGYHGWFGYDCFSHKKSVMVKSLSMEPTLSIRYPPYTDNKMKMAQMMLGKSVKSGWGMSFFLITSLSVIAAALFFF